MIWEENKERKSEIAYLGIPGLGRLRFEVVKRDRCARVSPLEVWIGSGSERQYGGEFPTVAQGKARAEDLSHDLISEDQ